MLSVIKLDEREKWDSIVKGFKNYDVYYLANYTKAFKVHGDGEPTLFYYEDGNIKAINVVMKRDVADDQKFIGKILPNTFYDLTTPYGYGGFLVEGNIAENSLKALDYEYSSFCEKEGIISEFVRFHPVLNNNEHAKNFYNVTNLGKTITLPLTSSDEIWNNLSTNKKRWVKKNVEVGVKIYWGRNPELFKQFKQMYDKTMEKNNAKDYYYFNEDFYKSVLHDMSYNSLIFYAVYEEQKVAMVLVIYGENNIHHHLSASVQEFQHLAPTNLLMYEVACWGSENGFNSFHMGGGVGSNEDTLYKFKQGFNKKSNTNFSIGKKIFNVEKYKQLIEIRKMEEGFDESTLFFPLYRM
ncbi:peptidoglycan bridge formation glycyltransferase FemA/FemB family protein [Lysinibacillus sp. LZ02]|uniref:peptidoglycan bridge formation glycyltransferase FemA/FemB family protein n=1 Tax=Lysinibacillus sp. LZ02 TaxID=3420668 RepID=UPI003D35B3EC